MHKINKEEYVGGNAYSLRAKREIFCRVSVTMLIRVKAQSWTALV